MGKIQNEKKFQTKGEKSKTKKWGKFKMKKWEKSKTKNGEVRLQFFPFEGNFLGKFFILF